MPLFIRVGEQLSLQIAPIKKVVYQPRGINVVQLLFKKHFQSFADQYENKYAVIYGRFRQFYEVDPLECSRCGSPMKVLAVITEPQEVRKILRHLVKIGRSPPGFDPTSLN